jgi:hypothetical protein
MYHFATTLIAGIIATVLARACIQLGGVCQGTEQNQTRNTVL